MLLLDFAHADMTVIKTEVEKQYSIHKMDNEGKRKLFTLNGVSNGVETIRAYFKIFQQEIQELHTEITWTILTLHASASGDSEGEWCVLADVLDDLEHALSALNTLQLT